MAKNITNKKKDTIVSILNKFQDNFTNLNVPFTSFANLSQILDETEINLLLSISCDTPIISSEKLINHASLASSPCRDEYSQQFVRLNKQLSDSFNKLNVKMKQEINQDVFICSGYRSPSYQILIFLKELYEADYDMELAQRVAKLPAQSQHCQYPFHAIDLCLSVEDVKKDKLGNEFEKSSAYTWLVNNANEYGFFLSYTKFNNLGTIFEPWHWQYNGK